MERNILTVKFVSREKWREWLRRHHVRLKEVWLILPKKSAGGASYRLYYNEALEEAICYGWIDSRIRSLDDTRSMVRFTPRKSKNWSRYNLAKALGMLKDGKMTRSGLRALPEGIVGTQETRRVSDESRSNL